MLMVTPAEKLPAEMLTAAQLVRREQRFPYKGWYGVIVRSGHEQEAADDFRNEGVLAYWPNYAEQQLLRKHQNGGHRRRCIFRPIIPGYLFCPSAGPEWRAFSAVAMATRSVINIVRMVGGQPALATNAEIEIIRQIEAATNGEHAAEFKWTPPGKTAHRFKINDLVRFLGEAYAQGLSGKITKLLSDGRIRVEAPLMGRSVPFDVWPHQIEVV